MKLVPALSWTPTSRWAFFQEGRKRAFDDTSAAMIKAVNTLVPQEVPPTSTELTAVDGVK